MREVLTFDQFKHEIQKTRFVNLQPRRREYVVHNIGDTFLAPFSYDGTIYHSSSDDGMIYRYYTKKDKWYIYYKNIFGAGNSLNEALKSMYETFDGVITHAV
jgi:hypothetical protein